MRQERERSVLGDFKSGLDLGLFLAGVWSKPLEGALRVPGSVGSRYFAAEAALALLLIPAACVLGWGPGHHPAPVVLFWWSSLGLLVVHAVARRVDEARGQVRHSRYVGDSWFPGGWRARLVYEPAAAAGFGLVLMPVSPPVGTYWLVGAVSLVVNAAYMKCRDDAVVREMRDGAIAQSYYGQRYREGGDE